jgi:carbamate kinase
MTMSKYVISLGGNALGNDPKSQKELLKHVSEAILPLIKEGHDIVLVHGNGPQVGMINLAFNESTSTPMMPFAECGAMSQGYIGFHIQNALINLIEKEHLNRKVTTLVTQVLVDQNDPRFKNPSKPIGSFYSKEEADGLSKSLGYDMVEDAGRGYRRVVPSPLPVDVIEKESLLALLEKHHIVISGGGGGIPVVKDAEGYHGVDAVIDKDFASAKIAEIIKADALIILTAVDHVYLNFNEPNQIKLEKIHVDELEMLIKENHFKKGSMLPKVQACISFVKHSGHKAIIASLDQAYDAIVHHKGTEILPR